MDSWLENFARTSFLRSGDTAHDLKTPLNVAILNLELLRMRIRKLVEHEDEKITEYTRSIEVELRRMAQIFDAFFLLSTPPKAEGPPVAIDVCSLCKELGEAAGYALEVSAPLQLRGHESRIRQALRLFFEGASRILKPEGRVAAANHDHAFHLVIVGEPEGESIDLSKAFKFYYTDRFGNPDLSLAAARLIAETYGGELNASEEHGKVTLRMSFPLGEK